MDHNALRNTTNSPPLLPLPYFRRDQKEDTNLWNSEESYHSSFAEIKDDIYNAQRVLSDVHILDDTDVTHPPSHNHQVDLPISFKQDNRSRKQRNDATSRALESNVPAIKAVDSKKVHRNEKLPEMNRQPHLRYSEPLPHLSRPFSADCHLRSCKSLDCLRLGSDDFVEPKSLSDKHPPSSEESLAAALCAFLFPLSPCRPPIARRPTPPGLPTFGTREAQELRLTPASQSKLAKIGRRVLRYISADTLPTQREGDSPPTAPVEAHQQHTNAPADMLKRMLGIARPVSLPIESYLHGRSKLPKGVKMAPTAGPLIQAEDGTYVRGRWGPRTSGHGIGQRTVEVHPFARLRDSSVLDEAIREIDKAHEREQARVRSPLPRDVSTVAPSRSEASNALMFNPDGITISSFPLRTSVVPTASSMKRHTHIGRNSAPSQLSYHMVEPHPYSRRTRPDRAIDTLRIENSIDGRGGRNIEGVVESEVAIGWLQNC